MSQFNQNNQRVNQQQNAGRDIIITNIRRHPWIIVLFIIALLVAGSLVVWHTISSDGPTPLVNPSLTPTPTLSDNPWTIIPGYTAQTQLYYNGTRVPEGKHYLNIGVRFQNTSYKQQSLDPSGLELVYKTGEVYREAAGSSRSVPMLVSAGGSSTYMGVYFEVPDAEGCFILTVSDGSGGRVGNWHIGDRC